MSTTYSTVSVPSVADVMPDSYDILKKDVYRITTGIQALDDALHSIDAQYVVVKAQAGQGKTAFAITLAAHCISSKQPVLFVSLELSFVQVVKRFFSLFTNSQHNEIDLAMADYSNVFNMSPENKAALMDGIKAFDAVKDHLYLVDSSSEAKERNFRYIERISIETKKLCNQLEMPCVVVCDYFQLLSSSEARGNSTEAYDLISHKLSSLAHSTGSSVIALSSVVKDGSTRGTGQIIFDTDVLLNLEEATTKKEFSSTTIRPMIIQVVKNRNGQAGQTLKVNYRPASHRFFDVSEAVSE